MEYSAASDAFTACPEGFNEFFNQRRRWMPSTIANIFDLLMDYKNVVKKNPDISTIYVCYQVSTLCPNMYVDSSFYNNFVVFSIR